MSEDVRFRSDVCCTNSNVSSEAVDLLADTEATRYTLLSLQALVCALTVSCNGCILVAVIFERQLRSLRNAYLVSLATADLIMGGVVMPLTIVQQMSPTVEQTINISMVWRTFDVFASTASVWSICCIAIERYAAIRQPVYCRQTGTKRKVCILISGVWMLSFLMTLPVLVSQHCITDYVTWSITIDVVFVFVSFVLPAVVTLWVYLKIFRIAYLLVKTLRAGQLRVKVNETDTAILRVHQGSLPRPSLVSQAAKRYVRNGSYRTSKLVSPDTIDSLAVIQMALPSNGLEDRSRTASARGSIVDAISVGSSNDTNSTSLRRIYRCPSSSTTTSNIKATKTLGRVILCFLVALTPKSIMILMHAATSDAIAVKPAIMLLVMFLGHANSLLNPLIYGWSLAEFQKVFLRWTSAVLKRCCPSAHFNQSLYSIDRSSRPCPSVASCSIWANNSVLMALPLASDRTNQTFA